LLLHLRYSGFVVRIAALLVLVPVIGCGRIGYESTPLSGTDADPSTADANSVSDAGTCPSKLSDIDCRNSLCATEEVCLDLALLLHFDDGTGTDSSGLGNHASCAASCPSQVAGQFGSGFAFASTDYYEVPHHKSLDAPDQVTISAWFYANSFPADFAPIVSKWVPSPEQSNYRLAISNDIFYVNYNNAAGWQNHPTSAKSQTGRWYHLVAQIDDSTDSVRLYRDGVLVTDVTDTQELELDSGSIYIGWAPNELGIDGIIDEVAVWTRILSPAEIAALY
jgi:hypothetical protein